MKSQVGAQPELGIFVYGDPGSLKFELSGEYGHNGNVQALRTDDADGIGYCIDSSAYAPAAQRVRSA